MLDSQFLLILMNKNKQRLSKNRLKTLREDCLLDHFLHVFRLLSQLDETERAFDEFWARHQTKLEQCLQLRHFEHNYREVSWFLLDDG